MTYLDLKILALKTLKQLGLSKRAGFRDEEKPSQYLIDMLKESEEDIKAGRVSPAFDNAQDAIKWLHSQAS